MTDVQRDKNSQSDQFWHCPNHFYILPSVTFHPKVAFPWGHSASSVEIILLSNFSLRSPPSLSHADLLLASFCLPYPSPLSFFQFFFWFLTSAFTFLSTSLSHVQVQSEPATTLAIENLAVGLYLLTINLETAWPSFCFDMSPWKPWNWIPIGLSLLVNYILLIKKEFLCKYNSTSSMPSISSPTSPVPWKLSNLPKATELVIAKRGFESRHSGTT